MAAALANFNPQKRQEASLANILPENILISLCSCSSHYRRYNCDKSSVQNQAKLNEHCVPVESVLQLDKCAVFLQNVGNLAA